MCQLCAVIVTGNRVFRRDGVRHHSNLRELLIVDYPNEVADGVEAEFDLLARQWGYGDARAVLAKVGPERARLLYQFEQENFVDADAFIRFVEHAGPPNRRDGDATLCLTVGAENDYEAKCAPLYADYEAKRDALGADYDAKCAAFWINLFANPENRIAVWR